jgi:hypothetical protein
MPCGLRLDEVDEDAEAVTAGVDLTRGVRVGRAPELLDDALLLFHG